MISLLGGKWTTYRLMAEDTVNAIDEVFGSKRKCLTHDFQLVGNDAEIQQPALFEDQYWERLLSYYGCQTSDVLELDSGKEEKLHPAQPYLKAEVVFACRNEMAETIRDFMARRIRWEILDWQSCFDSVEKVGHIMAEELGWTQDRKEKEIQDYQSLLKHFQNNLTL